MLHLVARGCCLFINRGLPEPVGIDNNGSRAFFFYSSCTIGEYLDSVRNRESPVRGSDGFKLEFVEESFSDFERVEVKSKEKSDVMFFVKKWREEGED